MRTKTNQIMAIIVIRPMAEEINLLKVETPLPEGFPKGPNPRNPPSGASGIWAKFLMAWE
jgi:hypothetical protein